MYCFTTFALRNFVRRLFVALLALLCTDRFVWAAEGTAQRSPNFIVIFCDDLGYGDIGPFGHPTIDTPHLDQMAREGMKFTQFYSGSSVCTPSRAALLTGRLPIRNGMCHDQRRVLFPDSQGGLPQEELTIAEVLKSRDYATACIGKWHLGHLPRYLPTKNGFDSYFGIPYSNDMDRLASSPKSREAFWNPKVEYFNVPLLRDDKIIERPADQTTITRRYTEEAVRFIRQHRERPFFLYLPHSLPHVPLFRSSEFAETSRRGLYGDVVEEIDWSVGEVLKALRQEKLAENTLVFFTSDNGPWLIFGEHGGSAGLLKDGKGCTWEGGMREPALAWWPGSIPAGETTAELGSTMDLMATFCSLSGAQLPSDRVLDSFDLSPVLLGQGESPRKSVLYYRGTRLMAARLGPWKAHFMTQSAYGGGKPETHDPPLLFNLEHDPSERNNVAAQHSEEIAKINDLVAKHRENLVVAKSQLGP